MKFEDFAKAKEIFDEYGHYSGFIEDIRKWENKRTENGGALGISISFYNGNNPTAKIFINDLSAIKFTQDAIEMIIKNHIENLVKELDAI